MTRYPTDPSNLIRQIRDVNAEADKLRGEGWTVYLESNANDCGTRVHARLSRDTSYDKEPQDEA